MVYPYTRNVCAIVILVLVATALLLSSAPTPPSSGASDGAVSVTNLDFGEVWAQKDFEWPVTFTNETDKTIDIEKLSASCECVRVNPESCSIVGGGAVEAALTLDLRPCKPPTSPGEAREFSAHIVTAVGASGGNQQFAFTLKGRVRDPLSLSAPHLRFADADNRFVGRQATFLRKVVHFEAACPLQEVTASANPPIVWVASHLESQDTGLLEVTPVSNLPPGKHECEVRILVETVDGETLPAIWLPVTAEVLYHVQMVPSRVSFRPAPVGDELETVVVLRSMAGLRFAVESINVGTEDLIIEPAEVDVPGGYAYRACQRVSALGGHSTTAEFVVAGEEGDMGHLRLDINYIGIAQAKQSDQ